MSDACKMVRHVLEEDAPASREVAAHVAGCAGCRAHAALLGVLARLEPGVADEPTVARIVAALGPAPWQARRDLSWLPLAASLALVAAGLGLLGGLPASGAVGGFFGWLASWTLDSLAAARGSSDALHAVLAAGSGWVLVSLTVIALGGGWAAAALLRRDERR